ncbi:hypothetical protein LTR10_006151 [Elasticomyces elasticus]|nr:hypothetical protein LTR10_006151 [Elasticomyces elasticus]KAK4966798.1 hypothetical protein LTR42_011110 [Elasticomyces elasticus]
MAAHKRKANEDGNNKKVPYQTPILGRVALTSMQKNGRPIPPSISTRTTRNMTRHAPGHAVFATAELLENILIYAPVKTVFGVQRVCRQSCDIVKTSMRLRDKLCLRPPAAGPGPVETWADVYTGLITGNGAAVRKIVDISNMHDLSGRVRYVRRVTSRPSPLLDVGIIPGHTPRSRLEFRMAHGDFFTLDTRRTRLTDPGSWKNTHMAALPRETLKVRVGWEILTKPALSGVSSIRVRVQDLAIELTLGAIFDAAMRSANSTYRRGEEGTHYQGPLSEVIARFESETGKRAILREFEVFLESVIVPTSQDRAMVRDAYCA